jgi:hypothetical protein
MSAKRNRALTISRMSQTIKLPVLQPCDYRLPVGEHLFCAHPQVHLEWAHNFLTVTPRGKPRGAEQCRRCQLAGPITVDPRPTPATFITPTIPETIEPQPRNRPLPPAPGTELRKMIRQMRIPEPAGCGCRRFEAKMNRWAVEGCRKNYAAIEKHLIEQRKKTSEFILARAAILAVRHGLPKSLPGLIAEAIRRAEG